MTLHLAEVDVVFAKTLPTAGIEVVDGLAYRGLIGCRSKLGNNALDKFIHFEVFGARGLRARQYGIHHFGKGAGLLSAEHLGCIFFCRGAGCEGGHEDRESTRLNSSDVASS